MEHPFDTLQEAVAVVTAGSTVHIAEGSYIAGYAIPFDAISIIGVGSENVIISVTDGSIGFDLNGSNISISGVSISGGLYGIRATGQNEIHLSDLIVYGQSAGFDQDACGIRIDNCSDVVIANSSFHSIVGGECDTGTTGARGAGICVFASTSVTISGVTAYDIVGGRGEYMGWPNHQGGAGSGVVVDGGASTVTVKDSVFRDILGGPGGHDYTSGSGGRGIGVFVNNGSNTVIRNCLMYNIRGGTSEEGISAYGWGYCAFVATSGAFLLDGITCVGSGWEKQRGIVNGDGVVGPVAITNSIFADLPSSCLYNHANNNVTALVASYSDLWDCGTTPAVNSTVLSSCIAVSPEFVDASTNNYHLQPLSPAIDSGKPSSPYCNEPVPNGCRVDMGVYGNTDGATSAPGASHCACCEPDETRTEEGFCAISASQTCLGRDDGVICDDGNVCTSFDTCENETCVGRQIAGCQTAPLVIHVQPPASTPYPVDEGSIILDLMTYPVDSSGDAVVPHVPDRDRIAIYMVADKPMMVALVPRGLSGSVILDASSTASYIVRLLVGGWLLPQDMTSDFMSVIASEIDTASLVTAVAEANSVNESPFTTEVSSLRTDINSSLVTAVQSFELWFAAHPISWTPDDSINTRTNALATATGSISPSGRLGGFKPTTTVDVDFLLTTIHNDRVRPGRAIINRLTPTSVPRVAQEDIPSGRFSYVNTLADLFGGGGGPVEGTTTSLEPVSLSTGPNTLRLSVISSSTTTFIPESSQYHDDFLWAQRQFWWEIVFLPALDELFGFAIGESEFSCAIGLAQYSLELNSLDWEGEDFSFIAVAGLIWDFLQGSDWGTCILGPWSARLIKLAKVAGNLLNIVKVFEYLTNGTMGILSETINAPAGVQWDINVCVPSCDGVTCGDDQCGDNCPDACPAGSSCNYLTSTCQPICECNSALDPCCSDGCNFDGASRVCNPGVATRYTCPNGSCGEDVYVSHQIQYCSGSS
ncbi:MAG TPA: right-handed parallel beta-helix repeat-containing protein, partial [Candidatus Syntrophosphaera sp.]|nr:right-handed parallel beta-helix repeat-containing protein [Candidatus Syntrophosphaera sp.]